MPPEGFLKLSDETKSKKQLIRELAELRCQLVAKDRHPSAQESTGKIPEPLPEIELNQSETRFRLLYENVPLSYFHIRRGFKPFPRE